MSRITDGLGILKERNGFQEAIRQYQIEKDHYFDRAYFSSDAAYESAKRAFLQAYYNELKPLYELVYPESTTAAGTRVRTTSYADDRVLQQEGLLGLVVDFRRMEADARIRKEDDLVKKQELINRRRNELQRDVNNGKDNFGAPLAWARENDASMAKQIRRYDGTAEAVPAQALEDSGITDAQRDQLREVHKWMIRNCARTGMGSFFGSAGSVRQYVNEFMQKPAKDQLKALELIQNGSYKSDDAARQPLGTNFVPDLDKIKGKMTASKWKFWKRRDGSYLYWQKLETAMDKVKTAKGEQEARAKVEAGEKGDAIIDTLDALSGVAKDQTDMIKGAVDIASELGTKSAFVSTATNEFFADDVDPLTTKDNVFLPLKALNAIRAPFKAVSEIKNAADAVKSDLTGSEQTIGISNAGGALLQAGGAIIDVGQHINKLAELADKVPVVSNIASGAAKYGAPVIGAAAAGTELLSQGVQLYSEHSKGKHVEEAKALQHTMENNANHEPAASPDKAAHQQQAEELKESVEMASDFSKLNQSAAKKRFIKGVANAAIYTAGVVVPVPGSLAIASGIATAVDMKVEHDLGANADTKQNRMIQKWGISEAEMNNAVTKHIDMLKERRDEQPEGSDERRRLEHQIEKLEGPENEEAKEALKEQIRLEKARTGGFLRKQNLVEHYAEKEADRIMRNAHLKDAEGEIKADNIIKKDERAERKARINGSGRNPMTFDDLKQEAYEDLEKGYGHKAKYHKGKETRNKTREQDLVDKYNKDHENLKKQVIKTMNS